MNIYLGKVGSINLDMPPWSIAIFNGDILGTIYKRYAGKLIKQQIATSLFFLSIIPSFDTIATL